MCWFLTLLKDTVKETNKYLTFCDPKSAKKHIAYLNRNNLYRYAASRSPQTGQFKWIIPWKISLVKNDDNSLRGCILEVHLEYQKESHYLHND